MQNLNPNDDFLFHLFGNYKELKIQENKDNMIRLSKENLGNLFDILLPYTITLGRPFKLINDFLNALIDNQVVFLLDTNILIRAEEMLVYNGKSDYEAKLNDFRILASFSVISMIFNTGKLYMPALLEIINSEELKGANAEKSIDIAYKKLFNARVVIECIECKELVEYALGKSTNISIDTNILANENIVRERLRNECSALAIESFFYCHNQLEVRMFQRDVAYCYMCKAYLLNSTKNISKQEKISTFIDWIKNDFLVDTFSFNFAIKLFTNAISFPKKKKRPILQLLDNQARDMLFIRDFIQSCREITNKDIIFVSMDKKLLKLFGFCNVSYDNNNKIRICLSEQVFDGCNLGKNDIDLFFDKLSNIEGREYPREIISKINEIKCDLENDIIISIDGKHTNA